VLTHGFVVDGDGKKMSKSKGNVIAPSEIVKQYGADILRLWVSAEDYRDDIRISPEILQRLSEAYRRIRNTCRFLLGNLADFKPKKHMVPAEELMELDRFALDTLNGVIARVREAYDKFDFHVVFHTLYNYCTVDLSSFYLDILKDRLYCERAAGPKRRSAQTALYYILEALVELMAPVLAFTAEEVWSKMSADSDRAPSVHGSAFPEAVSRIELTSDERTRWETMAALRQDVNKALEEARAAKKIGSSLEAKVAINAPDEFIEAVKTTERPEDFFIVSELELKGTGPTPEEDEASGKLPGVTVDISSASGDKCPRCWIWSTEIGTDDTFAEVCPRCAGVLKESGFSPS
jgi:isoleucyl-tRNA synthetase